MSDGTITYTALLIGSLLLIPVITRLLPFGKKLKGKEALLYYKIALKERAITTITCAVLEEDTKKLSNNNYELIFLADLEMFTKKKVKLPEKSFLLALDESYSHLLKIVLPVLVKENITLIIFLPILISPDNNKYQEKDVQQLNDFIFSEEFKNIFSYTQLNH